MSDETEIWFNDCSDSENEARTFSSEESLNSYNISIPNIISILTRKITERGISMNTGPISQAVEEQLADKVESYLITLLDENKLVFEETLDFGPNVSFNTNNDASVMSTSILSVTSTRSVDYEPDQDDLETVGKCLTIGGLTKEQFNKFRDYVQKHPGHKGKTLKKNFRFLKELSEWSMNRLKREALKQDRSDTRRENVEELHQCLWQHFTEQRSSYNTVRDQDLQVWAINFAGDLGLEGFKASASFVFRWKQRFGVVSRRVTKVISKRNLLSQDEKESRAKEFTSKINKMVEKDKVQHSNVFNADQTGIPYEIVSNRTHSYRGEKSTFASVQSVNSTKHSFTAMILISADGRIRGKTLVCLQEKDGRFPAGAMATMHKPHNLTVTCTRSGLFTESIFQYWVKEVLSKTIPRDEVSIFIADSWAPHKNLNNYTALETSKECRVEIIPAQTTSICQPLDLHFNRQLKTMVRLITHQIRIYVGEEINLFSRNYVLSIASVAIYQLSAPVFREMIKYSFIKSKIITANRCQFNSVIQVSRVSTKENCNAHLCFADATMSCSWCEEKLCVRCMVGIKEKQPHYKSCKAYQEYLIECGDMVFK